jgi:hypothetical protein
MVTDEADCLTTKIRPLLVEAALRLKQNLSRVELHCQRTAYHCKNFIAMLDFVS